MSNSSYDDVLLIGKILSSKTCLMILKYLAVRDASNQELYEKLKSITKISYRSSIFEALKRIKKAGLVEKYYDDKDKQIKYKLKYRDLLLEFRTLILEFK